MDLLFRYKYHRFVQRYRCLLGARIPRGAPTKEVARVIVDRYLTAPNDSYSLGATKIFLRENLGTILETERRNIQEFEVVKLQQHVRGYLARKRYLKMKDSALKIQSAYRGYKVRAKYQRVRKGIVAMQAVYRLVHKVIVVGRGR